MIAYEIYKLTHFAGMFLLFNSFGAYAFSNDKANAKNKAIAHGVGLLLVLIGGFGMLARLQISWPFPLWTFAKLGVWLLFGASIVVFKRKLLNAKVALALMVALAVAAGYLALYKPF